MSEGQRTLMKGGGAVVVIVIALVFLVRGGGQSGTLNRDYTVHGVCLACEQEGETTQAMDAYAPFVCPSCDAHAMYPWFYCDGCCKRFVPELVRPDPDGPLRLPMGIRCPACGGTQIGQYDPQMPTQTPVGDAPLPKWEE